MPKLQTIPLKLKTNVVQVIESQNVQSSYHFRAYVSMIDDELEVLHLEHFEVGSRLSGDALTDSSWIRDQFHLTETEYWEETLKGLEDGVYELIGRGEILATAGSYMNPDDVETEFEYHEFTYEPVSEAQAEWIEP